MKMQFPPEERYHFTLRGGWVFVEPRCSVGGLNSNKPRGVWYCFGQEWLDYTEREEPEALSCYPYAYRLDLDETKLLRVETSEEGIKWLMRKYGYWAMDILPKVNWDLVAKDYAGIEFDPYYKWDLLSGERPLETGYIMLGTFVNSLDIASGCIWHPSGVIRAEGPITVDLPQ
jgi:hypothetical protein